MNEIEFLYIGWCNTTDRNGTKHDKVWTAFKVNDTYYAGWGKRDKALSFKKYGTGWSAEHEQNKVKRTKEKKYTEVDSFQLFTIFPFFKDEVDQRLVFCTLANKIK